MRLVGDSSRESMTRAMIIASRHRFPRANPTRQRSPQALPLSLTKFRGNESGVVVDSRGQMRAMRRAK